MSSTVALFAAAVLRIPSKNCDWLSTESYIPAWKSRMGHWYRQGMFFCKSKSEREIDSLGRSVGRVVRRYTTDAEYGGVLTKLGPGEDGAGEESDISKAKEDESNGDNCKAPKPNVDISGIKEGEPSEIISHTVHMVAETSMYRLTANMRKLIELQEDGVL